MRNIREIIIHCSYTPSFMNIGADVIKKWHMNERGWSDIGYHYVIKLDGTVEQGRPLEIKGAHCKGHNDHTIGICYVGGMGNNTGAEDTRTESQKESIRRLVDSLCIIFPDIKKISSHSTYSNKKCPCFDAEKEFAKYNEPNEKV